MRFLKCMCGVLSLSNKCTTYNMLLNVRHVIPLFETNKYDVFHYGSEERRRYKNIYNLRHLVQDHHCIPYQYRNHKLIIETNFNVNCSRNILIMPNKHGIEKLKLHPNTLIHDGGHPAYNKYIGKQLEKIYLEEETIDGKQYKIWLFLHYLKDKLRYKNNEIPWI